MTRECNGLFVGKERRHAIHWRSFISGTSVDKLKHIAGPLALLIALMLYTALGGLIFRYLELPSEILRLGRVRADLIMKRNHLVNLILNNRDTINLGNLFKEALSCYENAIQKAVKGGFLISLVTEIKSIKDEDIVDLPPVVTERWNLLQAIFFASTVITTIGYGNVVPLTLGGRIFCIFYAFIGIPLTLTAIAAWGKLFAEAVNNLANELSARLPSLLTCLIPGNIAGRRSLGAFAAVVLLFIYLSCGAAMFMLWEEDWDFFDGFYFWFVTMTTIGFGDLVPKKPKYMLLCSLYILVGLALTGTIIELVRMQYNQSWQRLQALRGPLGEALKKLGEQAGPDMSALQSDLKKVLAVVSMPKFRKKNGQPMEHSEWEDAVQAVFKTIEANQRQKIVQIIIYESNV